MIYRLLADLVVVLHLGFVVFVVAGSLLVLFRRRVAWVHLPAVAWAVLIELAGWICPLTPLENRLRERGGGSGYSGDFVERYIMPVLYPAPLTREMQIAFGLGVLLLNAVVYALIVWRWRRRRRRGKSA